MKEVVVGVDGTHPNVTSRKAEIVFHSGKSVKGHNLFLDDNYAYWSDPSSGDLMVAQLLDVDKLLLQTNRRRIGPFWGGVESVASLPIVGLTTGAFVGHALELDPAGISVLTLGGGLIGITLGLVGGGKQGAIVHTDPQIGYARYSLEPSVVSNISGIWEDGFPKPVGEIDDLFISTFDQWISNIATPFEPWPPPKATWDFQVFGEPIYKIEKPIPGSIHEGLLTIRKALTKSGYSRLRYYSVPDTNGLVIATMVEQIDEKGFSLDERQRWLRGPQPLTIDGAFTWEYFRRLLYGSNERSRMFLFFITEKTMQLRTGMPLMSRDDAESIIDYGDIHTIDLVGEHSIGDVNCTVFIFEFSQHESDSSSPIFLEKSSISAEMHMRNSGIWKNLETTTP